MLVISKRSCLTWKAEQVQRMVPRGDYLVVVFARSNGELHHAHDLFPIQVQGLGANNEIHELRDRDQLWRRQI